MPWQTNAGFLVAVAAVRVRTFWCRVAAVSELCPVAETRQLKRSVETRARPRVSFQRAVTDYSKAFFEHSKSRLAVLRYATPHAPTQDGTSSGERAAETEPHAARHRRDESRALRAGSKSSTPTTNRCTGPESSTPQKLTRNHKNPDRPTMTVDGRSTRCNTRQC